MTDIKPRLRLLTLILTLVTTISFSAEAAKVLQVKGNKVMIQLEGMGAAAGDEVYVVGDDKKPRGIVKLSAVKGDRAVGTITRGGARNGMAVTSKSGGSSAPAPRATKSFSTADTSGNDAELLRKSYKRGGGFLLGMAMNSASLSAKTRVAGVTVEDSLSMKGNSFNLKGFYDYSMSPSFTIRGAVGYETLETTGTTTQAAVCSNSTSCTLGLSYLSFEGAGQFNFVNSGNFRYWAGAGYAFLMAMSKNNNITNLEATSTNQVLLLGTGADIAVGKTGYIPVVVEYGLFPFAGISLSSIYIRAGYGWKF